MKQRRQASACIIDGVNPARALRVCAACYRTIRRRMTKSGLAWDAALEDWRAAYLGSIRGQRDTLRRVVKLI